jgi:DNA/RNA non-specific endonuclease
VVNKIRAPIDKALDSVVKWIVGLAKAFVGKAVGAVTAWWKARETFQTATGETHTLLMKGDENSADLMIQSKEQPYRDFLAEVDIGSSKEGKQTKDHALQSVNALAALLKVKADPKSKEGAEKATKVKALISSLVKDTKILTGLSDKLPPSTPPIFGGASDGGFATKMTVEGLRAGQTGSSPSTQSGANWKILSYRKTEGGYRYYRLGHLLNEELGGHGKDWTNLAPQSSSGNGTFYKQCEAKVKDALKTAGRAVRFVVTPVYGGAKPSWDVNWPAAEKKIAALEKKYVPVSYKATAELTWKGYNKLATPEKIPIGSGVYPNDITADDGDYHLTAQDRKELA